MIEDLDDLLLNVVNLTKKAGEVIMSIYRTPTHLESTDKKDGSPLTQADLQSNHVLENGLKEFANYPFLSEEGKTKEYSERIAWETFWLVDPLDGTKEFLNRTNEFTVNVALVHKGELMLGVVHAPALGITYYGSKSIGAFRQIKEEHIEKLPLPHAAREQIKVVVSKSHSSSEESEFIKKCCNDMPFSTISVGSSLKFCLLAEGTADFYPRLGKTYEWDTAAGHAVLNFSGGEVIDLESGKSLEYNKQSLVNNGFVAQRLTS